MGAPARSEPASTVAIGGDASSNRNGDPRPTISRAYHRAHRNIVLHGLRDARRLLVLIAADLAAFAVLWWALHGLREGWLGPRAAEVISQLFSAGFLGGVSRFSVALVISLFISGAYGAGQRRRDTGRVLLGVALAAFVSLYASAWERPLALVGLRFTATLLVVTPLLVLVRLSVDRVVRAVKRQEPTSRAVLVIHGGADVEAIQRDLSGVRDFRVVDAVRLGNGRRRPLDAALSSVEEVIERAKADTVILWTDLSPQQFAGTVDVALASGCRLLSAPRTPGVAGIQPRAVWVDGRPLVELTVPSLQAWELAIKRALDILGSLAGLVLLSPFLLMIAVWIRLDSPGPVLFTQGRLGRRGRPFRCFKFRSMRTDAEDVLRADPALYANYVGNNFKLPLEEDPRITRSGRFLRRTSLDELPQLLNVLRGEMSLVGPRPVVPDEIERYGGGAALFLSLKPGMTGAWAVNGRSRVGYPDRARLELEYIRTWSVASDIGILLRTIPSVIQRRGAH